MSRSGILCDLGREKGNGYGKDLPYAPYRSRTFNILKMFLQEKEMHIITFNRDKDVTPETLIPIERIQAPVLMLCLGNGLAGWQIS